MTGIESGDDISLLLFHKLCEKPIELNNKVIRKVVYKNFTGVYLYNINILLFLSILNFV
jgi:hypothetical protein